MKQIVHRNVKLKETNTPHPIFDGRFMEMVCENEFRSTVLHAAERLQAKLVRYSSRFFDGDIGRAQDIVQHAFLQLCRTDPESRPENIDPWLYRVCRNRAIDMQRQDKRRSNNESTEQIEQIVDERAEAFEQMCDRELYQLVQQRIKTLPLAQREAVELWADGLGYSGISAVLEKPETTIRVLVHRALSKLRSDKTIFQAIGTSRPRQESGV